MTAAQIAAMWRNDAKAEAAKAGHTTGQAQTAHIVREATLLRCAKELELHLEPQATDAELRAERAAELRLFREGRL